MSVFPRTRRVDDNIIPLLVRLDERLGRLDEKFDDRLSDQDSKLELIHRETKATNGRVTTIEKRHERWAKIWLWTGRTVVALGVAAFGGAFVELLKLAG